MMDPLSWTGPYGAVWTPLLGISFGIFLLTALFLQPTANSTGLGGTLRLWSQRAFLAVLGLVLILSMIGSWPLMGIIGALIKSLTPVWITLALLFAAIFVFKDRLGVLGALTRTGAGLIGLFLTLFWLCTGIYAGLFDLIMTHDPIQQISGMKNKPPGSPLRAPDGRFEWFLFGGDHLARDVFSRIVQGAWIVTQIAPAAAVVSFMVGISLGLPAGYFGGWTDKILSFLANILLAFPAILLFYLIVTPSIEETGLPALFAAILFAFPLLFLIVLLNARFHTRRSMQIGTLGGVILLGGWLYLALISNGGFLLDTPKRQILGLPAALDPFDIDPEILIVMIAVVFVNAPIIFRIVRGLTLDIRTRDYVSAARIRGEGPWYILLWEILPNARGPLIVDFCLRIGYIVILLGTLGFLGLGLESESPDWGTTISAARRVLRIAPHSALVPAFALMSLVLGLNLLADSLREASLKD